LLEAVSLVQSHFITEAEHRKTFDAVLKILLDYSASEYGFIGEVYRDGDGNPYLKAHAISNIAWNEETRALFDKYAEQGLEFRNLNSLFGAVMTTGLPVISNDPAHDPRSAGLPHGHPAMYSFLGLPLYNGQKMIGMLGIANRTGGYDEQFCNELTPLATTCASLIESWRGQVKRRVSEEALRQSEERFHLLVSGVKGYAIFMLDAEGVVVSWNAGAERIKGYSEAEICGKNVAIFYPQRDVEQGKPQRDLSIAADEGRFEDECWRIRKDGSQFMANVVISAIRDDAGKLLGFAKIIRDISRSKQNEEALQLAASVYQASHEGILVTDENNLILDANPAFTQLTGYSLDEVRGKNPSLFSSGCHDADFYKQMWQDIQDTGHWQGEIWDKRRDGELHAKWLNISIIRKPDGSVFRHVAQFSDITEKKRLDEQLWTQANFDALTNLPNRRLFADRIRQAMAAGVRSGLHGALLSLDLDHFKQLNDTYGHSMGDKLLIEVARRLQACVREEDTVARMGGDEFIVVLNELNSDQNAAAVQAEQVAEKIRIELSRPYQLDRIEYHSSSSIGIVLFRGHSDSQEELLAHVDVAMYQAKSKGRNAICFFDTSMQVALDKRSQLENALRVALVRGEFTLHYQLQIDNAGCSIGVEALLRWHNPQLGNVSPAQFIPVAEDTGLILPIGLWVLETACTQLACWQNSPDFHHLCIAVNVSSRQFREAAFVAQVRDTLQKTGIRPQVLKLELTESLVLDNVEDSIAKMNELRALGIRFSMDDFGTGFSSLSYLSRLPIDQLKIDQSFVRDITTDKNDAVIVQTIISMAQSLGLDVIAEGVGTQAQREFLEQRGCQSYQGYLYAKPLPIEELERKLIS
jgi:diguanylate cyclase (GGDEF)-like protein/PAS domain S-box-containing protein